MCLLVQYSLDNLLSMSSLAIHLSILGNSVAITSKLYFQSCLMICFSRNLIGPLFSVSSIECHQFFW